MANTNKTLNKIDRYRVLRDCITVEIIMIIVTHSALDYYLIF